MSERQALRKAMTMARANSAAVLLRRARAKIAKVETWTTRAFARTAEGLPTAATDPKAHQWCALGALTAVHGGVHAGVAFLHAARDAIYPGQYINAINDETGHEAVLSLYNRAIALADEAEAGA